VNAGTMEESSLQFCGLTGAELSKCELEECEIVACDSKNRFVENCYFDDKKLEVR
jgi:hypothetical protein